MKVCPNQSFDVQVDNKVYHCNTHHLSRRYPRVLILSEDSPIKDTPQRTLRCQLKVKMPHIPFQATMQKDLFVILVGCARARVQLFILISII